MVIDFEKLLRDTRAGTAAQNRIRDNNLMMGQEYNKALMPVPGAYTPLGPNDMTIGPQMLQSDYMSNLAGQNALTDPMVTRYSGLLNKTPESYMVPGRDIPNQFVVPPVNARAAGEDLNEASMRIDNEQLARAKAQYENQFGAGTFPEQAYMVALQKAMQPKVNTSNPQEFQNKISYLPTSTEGPETMTGPIMAGLGEQSYDPNQKLYNPNVYGVEGFQNKITNTGAAPGLLSEGKMMTDDQRSLFAGGTPSGNSQGYGQFTARDIKQPQTGGILADNPGGTTDKTGWDRDNIFARAMLNLSNNILAPNSF